MRAERCRGSRPFGVTIPDLYTAQAVRVTPEFRRVHALPRRNWETDPDLPELQRLLTARLMRPGSKLTLRPMQAQFLRDVHDRRGALVTADVGTGKTLPALLLGTLLGAKRCVYLVPGLGGGVAKMRADARFYAGEGARIPTTTFLSYEKLAVEKREKGDPGMLYRYRPQVLVCDEAGRLSNTGNFTWKIIAYTVKKLISEGEAPVCVFMDATFADDSIRQFGHLLRRALGAGAPVPDSWHEVNQWADALDVRRDDDEIEALDPGVLEHLSEIPDGGSPQARAREAFKLRLIRTPGVIATTDARPSAALALRAVQTRLPARIEEALTTLRRERVTPGGERIRYAMDLWRHAGELACGYYSRWDPEPPAWWLEPRRQYREFESVTLKHSRSLFKPSDVANALDSGQLPDLKGVELLRAWREVRDEFRPNSVAQWVDKTALDPALRWLEANPDHGLVWCSHVPAGELLSELGGVPFFASKGLPTNQRRFGKKRVDAWKGSAIVSLSAIWKGFNLQHHHHQNLYVDVPTTAKKWQQSLGRTHRSGQTKGVTADVWLACDEHVDGLAYAMRRAAFVQEMFGQPQKLLYAENELPACVRPDGPDEHALDDETEE